jgi:hypothetical protein
VALMLPPNWCLFFFRDPAKAFTMERLRECLRAEWLTVTGDTEPLAVRYKKRPGPTLFVSISRGDYLETIVRSLVGRHRKYRKLIPGIDTEVKVEFHDLEEVLDDLDTLTNVQRGLQTGTGGLGYNSWNQVFFGPDE